MHKLLILGLLVTSFWLGRGLAAKAATKGVRVVSDEAHRKVDITIDGKPFTSYIWPTSLKKPVLYPLITDEGVTVTRGYPLEPRPGERVDHPHHAGMWFNYGNVNGFDFWNNSDAIKPENRAKMGSIFQKKIVSAKSGSDRGELVVESVWVTGENKEILKDTTKYIFIRRKGARVIDQITTLQALDKVVFNDDKEGLLGMRVAHWLESPEEKGGIFMDASGRPTKVDAVDTTGATGVYLTSQGVRGEAAWATRGRWCTLTGHDPDKQEVTIGILDQTKNPGFPTYWHARGYGLFAANPFGRSIFDPKQPAFNYTLEKGKTATFHHRVILFSHAAGPDEMNREADAYEVESR
jgi:Methane oxygenase PmoA